MYMDEQKYLAQMEEQILNDDTEMAHGIADDILCDALTALGYKNLVEEYRKIEKWYA